MNYKTEKPRREVCKDILEDLYNQGTDFTGDYEIKQWDNRIFAALKTGSPVIDLIVQTYKTGNIIVAKTNCYELSYRYTSPSWDVMYVMDKPSTVDVLEIIDDLQMACNHLKSLVRATDQVKPTFSRNGFDAYKLIQDRYFDIAYRASNTNIAINREERTIKTSWVLQNRIDGLPEAEASEVINKELQETDWIMLRHCCLLDPIDDDRSLGSIIWGVEDQ